MNTILELPALDDARPGPSGLSIKSPSFFTLSGIFSRMFLEGWHASGKYWVTLPVPAREARESDNRKYSEVPSLREQFYDR
jgi:hypothetical protein